MVLSTLPQQNSYRPNINMPGTIAPTSPTLLSAMSLLDDLNQRLAVLNGSVIEIASTIGGPSGGPDNSKAESPPSSAMERLYRAAVDAHGHVTNIESAISSIRRSLGDQ